jgi:uncharacterized protein YidB (DUF937 family)
MGGILDMLTTVMAARRAAELDPAAVSDALREVLATGEQGGLSALAERLRQAGFGDQVQSWIGPGPGPRLPVSAQQLHEILGHDAARRLAVRLGIPTDQLAIVLAAALPDLVNRAGAEGWLLPTTQG